MWPDNPRPKTNLEFSHMAFIDVYPTRSLNRLKLHTSIHLRLVLQPAQAQIDQNAAYSLMSLKADDFLRASIVCCFLPSFILSLASLALDSLWVLWTYTYLGMKQQLFAALAFRFYVCICVTFASLSLLKKHKHVSDPQTHDSLSNDSHG
jgi:hypothetical protein